jgi:hypothetical protein
MTMILSEFGIKLTSVIVNIEAVDLSTILDCSQAHNDGRVGFVSVDIYSYKSVCYKISSLVAFEQFSNNTIIPNMVKKLCDLKAKKTKNCTKLLVFNS